MNIIAIIGVGLLGGSVGAAVRKRMPGSRVIGFGRNEGSLRTAKSHGLIHEYTLDLAAAVREADLIIVASPVQLIAEHVKQIGMLCKPSAIVTDVGSTKRTIVNAVGTRLLKSGARFIGSHPIAGGEKAGPTAARHDLFVDRTVVITPAEIFKHPVKNLVRSQAALKSATKIVAEFWETLGAKVQFLSPKMHDQLLAATSHLPHLVACVLAARTKPEEHPFIGTGWLGTTRVASGEAELWTQIFLDNSEYVLKQMKSYQTYFDRFERAIKTKNARQLTTLLQQAKEVRDALEN